MGRHRIYSSKEEYLEANKENALRRYYEHNDKIKRYNRLNSLKYYYEKKLSQLTPDNPLYEITQNRIEELRLQISQL